MFPDEINAPTSRQKHFNDEGNQADFKSFVDLVEKVK